jgi:Tol biopolymer transport system component
MTARLVRAGLVRAALVLMLPLAAGATGGKGHHGKSVRASDGQRMVFATDSSGNLRRFKAKSPESARSKAITGRRAQGHRLPTRDG